MKKLAIIFSVLLMLGMASCGNGKGDETVEVKDETPKLKGYEELNLSEWGFNLSVMVPNAEANGDPMVLLTDRGTLEVVVGSGFGIEIMYADMDIALLKTDLADHLIFSHEILKEEENSLIYTQDIPEANSGVKTQNHFFHQVKIGADFFTVSEIASEEYGKGMVEEMLLAAKTIKAVEAPVVVDEAETEV